MVTDTLSNGLKALFGTSISSDNNYGVAVLNNASGHQGEPAGIMSMANLKSTLDVVNSSVYNRGNNSGPVLVKLGTLTQNFCIFGELLCYNFGSSSTEYTVHGYCKVMLGILNGAAKYKVIDTKLINNLKLYYKMVGSTVEYYAYYTGTNKYTYTLLFPYAGATYISLSLSSESIENLTEIPLTTT